jgi:hypothetical protein
VKQSKDSEGGRGGRKGVREREKKDTGKDYRKKERGERKIGRTKVLRKKR